MGTEPRQIAADLGSEYNNLSAALDGYAAALQPLSSKRVSGSRTIIFWRNSWSGVSIQRRPKNLGERIRRVEADFASQAGPLALPILYDPAAVIPGFRINSD